MAKETETPLMKQHREIKKQYPDAILLLRVGDFYETYGEDAVVAAGILGITLTKRSNAIAGSLELAGFPYHAIDTYLPKLVRAGYRVAVVDQLEDPKTTKTLVKRGVTELVTPGVSYNDTVLEVKSNNFVCCVNFGKGATGVSFLDISTGEFLVAQGDDKYVEKLLGSFAPKEILYERDKADRLQALNINKTFLFKLDDWVFTEDCARERLLKQYDVTTLKGFGVEELKEGMIAAGAILHYLDSTQHMRTAHITNMRRIDGEEFVWMDKFTIRNLELYGSIQGEGKSFINILDHTQTPMGSRLLKRWIAFPLKKVDAIRKRQTVVEHLFRNPELKEALSYKLPMVGDLERIISKTASGRINPRESVQLGVALRTIGEIADILSDCNDCPEIQSIASAVDACPELAERIAREIVDNPPIASNRGNIIREGVNAELDECRRLSHSGKSAIEEIQNREIEATGISSLKVGFNNVFGYYIEVRNSNKDKVPADWIRKQTLANAERYITQELKEYEEKVLGAEDRIIAIETQLYAALIADMLPYIKKLQANATAIAQLDVLYSFAQVAQENHYNCPVISDDDVLEIKGGRHPVIERQLPIGEEYISNDIYLDTRSQQIIIITGPNMAGKSALLRQTALITLMAQIGSFVPADSAHIGIVDKIFTRVGASDNISMGESTFMVEMNEAASILNNMTERSLVLFDELGRGTSTYDGISIAWAIVEHIHEHPTAKARTLFATHYHELNEMEAGFQRIKNYNVSVKEVDGKVIFLRKLVRGGSEHSFGIHVAKIAGMPGSIVRRATDILSELEDKGNTVKKPVKQLTQHREGLQLSMFQLDDPLLEQIRDEIKGLDLNNLTPIEALNKLNEIKKLVKG